MLTFFLLAGRYLDYRTRAVARSAAQELAALEVPRAIRLQRRGEVVPVAELAPGDLVRCAPAGACRSMAWSPPARPRSTARC
jgi:P-type Cu2+ transporter